MPHTKVSCLHVSSKIVLKTLFGLVGVVWSTFSYSGTVDVIGDVPLAVNPQIALGYPSKDDSDQVLVSRNQYSLSWNISDRVPQWVSWTLNKRFLGDVGRTNVFRFDHELSGYLNTWGVNAVSPTEYLGSCVDRGHQVASGDRTASVLDNQATFVMSNIAPQSAFLNRRSWVSFERFLRRLVTEQGKIVFVYSGGSGASLGAVGVNDDIQMRAKNFKIAVIKTPGKDSSTMRLLVVDFPNKTSTGTNPVTDREQACYDSEHTIRITETNRSPIWRPYVSTLASVKRSSGLNLQFLNKIQPISQEELDELVGKQIKAGFTYLNLQQIVRNSIDSIP